MKNAVSDGLRWLRQAGYDLNQAEQLLGLGNYAYAAFFAEQAAQKALKAFLMARGARFVAIHSVAELAKQASGHDQRFAALIDGGRRLDRHYVTSRYPDALPEPAIPAESYVKEDADEAVASARAIFDAVSAPGSIP